MTSLTPGFILFLFTFASGGLAFFLQYKYNQAIKLFLSFSGAFLLATCVMHLLPELFDNGNELAPFILIGFFLQIMIEFFSQGVEHGHIHGTSNKGTFPFLIYFGLCIHSFTEGLPLAGTSLSNMGSSPLYWSILLHKLPIAIVLVSLFSAHGVSKFTSLVSLIIFAALAPLGGFTGNAFAMKFGTEIIPYFLAASTGIFLHISTVILFESSSNHKFNYIKFLFILAGGLLSVLLF